MNLIDFERADRSRHGLDENTGLFLLRLSELLSVPAVMGAEKKTGTLYSDEDYRRLGQSLLWQCFTCAIDWFASV